MPRSAHTAQCRIAVEMQGKLVNAAISVCVRRGDGCDNQEQPEGLRPVLVGAAAAVVHSDREVLAGEKHWRHCYGGQGVIQCAI